MRTLFCSICLLLTIPAHAAAGPQPPSRPLQVGDMWTYRQTFEAPGKAVTVARPVFSIISENKDKALILGATNAELFSRSTTPAWTLRGMVSPDACIFDFTAQDTLGLKKTCGITLEPGKTWGSDESNTVARKEQRFTVLPDEEIAVPAGTFLSFKIQRDETVTEVAYPGVPEPAGGYVKVDRVLYWYSPDAKGFVKIARERRTSDGKLLFRLTEELEAFSKRAATGLNLGRPAAPAR